MPLDQVVLGDVVLIRSGERVAVDGEILAGSASVNQAAITGESMPVDREAGGSVFAGTLLEVGALEVRTTRVGDDTTLGQIRRMVAAAQSQRAPIERILDRYAKLYTPAALILGARLWWQSGDVLRAITVLIVFCPCVMVLATPTALVASIGNAALRGSLVKKGATIEALSRVDTVAFDKTGTLTSGVPRLVRVVALDGLGERDLLRACASAEKFSEHPLARSVIRAAERQGIAVGDPEQCTALPGLGVRAVTEGRSLLIGRAKLLHDEGLAIADDVAARATALAGGGRTVIVVASGPAADLTASKPVGLLVFEDSPRPEAPAALAALREAGVRTVLITGDNRSAAERVAATLGIDEVHADVSPQGKVEIVRRLQAKGLRVAFVGDGVNDAPSLAQADVGIAMGLAGTDVAIETAEIALLADDLSKLPHLLDLSRRAVRTIRQNLVFSLGVLGLAVGLTTLGFLTPVTGALLHEISSLPVIANSARLIGRRDRD